MTVSPSFMYILLVVRTGLCVCIIYVRGPIWFSFHIILSLLQGLITIIIIQFIVTYLFSQSSLL